VLDVFETGLLNSKWRSVNVVHLLPVMLENVVSNYATQAMTYNEDTVVLAATVQLAEELDASLRIRWRTAMFWGVGLR